MALEMGLIVAAVQDGDGAQKMCLIVAAAQDGDGAQKMRLIVAAVQDEGGSMEMRFVVAVRKTFCKALWPCVHDHYAIGYDLLFRALQGPFCCTDGL